MTWFITLPFAERALTLLLFTLYMITAVRLCRYSSWLSRGAPNPFLPRSLKMMLRKRDMLRMRRGQMPAMI